jgi:hypothetical protein
MAVLSEQERFDVWAEAMRGRVPGALELTKPELRAAVDAMDDWIDANSASFNSSIPQPARAALTTKQKPDCSRS